MINFHLNISKWNDQREHWNRFFSLILNRKNQYIMTHYTLNCVSKGVTNCLWDNKISLEKIQRGGMFGGKTNRNKTWCCSALSKLPQREGRIWKKVLNHHHYLTTWIKKQHFKKNSDFCNHPLSFLYILITLRRKILLFLFAFRSLNFYPIYHWML